MSRNLDPLHRATVADLHAIPEEQRFHELIDGAIVEKAAPSGDHGYAQVALGSLIFNPFGRRGGGGPGGGAPGGWWILSDVEIQFGDQVLRPDLAGWRRDRAPERPRGIPITVRPDWVCEILSTNKRNDLIRKKRIYHHHEVTHYWIVDPEEEMLTVHRFHPDGYLDVLAAERGQRVRAEPFDAVELPVGVLFGDDIE